MQSLMGVVESSLHYVYCPLGGLVMLAALWNKAFQQFSQRVIITSKANTIIIFYKIYLALFSPPTFFNVLQAAASLVSTFVH